MFLTPAVLRDGDFADARVPVRQSRAGVAAAEIGVAVFGERAALADVLRSNPDVTAERNSRAVVAPARASRAGRVAKELVIGEPVVGTLASSGHVDRADAGVVDQSIARAGIEVAADKRERHNALARAVQTDRGIRQIVIAEANIA